MVEQTHRTSKMQKSCWQIIAWKKYLIKNNLKNNKKILWPYHTIFHLCIHDKICLILDVFWTEIKICFEYISDVLNLNYNAGLSSSLHKFDLWLIALVQLCPELKVELKCKKAESLPGERDGLQHI